MLRWLLVGAVVFSLGLAGCGATEVGRPEALQPGWEGQAAAWVDGYDAAFDAGAGEHALFLAPDVVIDSVALAPQWHAVGRARGLRVQREVYEGPVERGELFVSSSGVARVESWTPASGAVDVLAWIEIGDDGISRHLHAVPLSDASEVDQTGVSRLVNSHEEVWRVGDGAAADLYSPDATLTDSIRGIHLAGAATIAGLATTDVDDPGADRRPSSSGVTTYVHPGCSDWALQVWARHPGAGPCGSDTVVALVLDAGGLIVSEHRFHALESLDACTPLRAPDDSWWVGRDLPEALGDRVTGTIRGPAGPVQIHNGGPAWERVVSWSVEQFTRAGLPAPDVSIVAFDPLDPRCGGRCGRAFTTPPTTVLICLDAAGMDQTSPRHQPDTVPLWPARLVLHELAHVWIEQHVDTPTRHQLLAHIGLPSWDDPSTAWEQHGEEWAAETLAWGLIDRVCTLTTVGTPPCDQLTEAFHTLTGVQPLTNCQAQDAGS